MAEGRGVCYAQVTEGDLVLEREGTLLFDDLVHPDASLEVSLDLGEGHDGAVSATTAVHLISQSTLSGQRQYIPELPLAGQGRREADSIVEGQLHTSFSRCKFP